MPRQVLFVCMGNICRSPMAEGVMRSLVERVGMQENVFVDSAGTHDYHVGESPDRRAQAAALRHGYDISRLRARQLASEDFDRFDLLLAMDFNNLASLRDRCPSGFEGKIGLLMPYARKRCSFVVHDPYYRSAGDFDLVLDCLEDACEGVLRVLCAAEAASGLGVSPLTDLNVPSNFEGG
jgi:protein-tyrosine phosphatase